MNKIEEYYNNNYDEWGRLLRHRVEFEMTKRALCKYIPPGSSVLDVGGGPGRYSIYLAKKGYDTSLIDLCEKLVEQAVKNSKNSGVKLKECIQGDVLYLDKILPNRKYDAILCMGPMYHLLEEAERKKAINQCMSRLKTGGILIVSFISAYAPMLDSLNNFPEDIQMIKCDLLRYFEDGRSISGHNDGFTDAYFFYPTEIEKFMSKFGLNHIKIMAVDCYGVMVEDRIKELPEESFQSWIDIFEEISSKPEVWGGCEHLLYIGRKV